MKTVGIDVGSSSIKFVMMEGETILAKHQEKMRRRDPKHVAEEGFQFLCSSAGVAPSEVVYIATTGEGEMVTFRTGHFYGMTTHARGGLYLNPDARAALDVGALHARAVLMDERGRVLQYKMTSQCASGSGQFLENISRYLGTSVDEIGLISTQSKNPEPCSSICAVLAETDVINMVSRGIKTADILKGIHLSIAGRLMKLLKACKAEGTVILTGGLSQDKGLLACLAELTEAEEQKKGSLPFQFTSHPDAVLAGAIGAAIWAAFRAKRFQEQIGA
ncbi:MAG: benzoyl-CoA reductase subunit D [Acidobacteria bacterium]|nr:benzoyl-CoA reductase subunit D [Acidobacteriota bacterium]